MFVGRARERVWWDRPTFLVSCPCEHHLWKGGHPHHANDVPSTIHEKKDTVFVKYTFVLPYSPLWLLRVTGNCFWFLDLPPVSKGLVGSPSLRLLLILFLVVWRLALQVLEILFFTRILTRLTAHADWLRYNRYAWAVGFGNFYTQQILEIPTDRATKVCEKLFDFRKS